MTPRLTGKGSMPSVSSRKRTASGAAPTKGVRVACFEWARALGCVAIVFLHVITTMHNAVGYEAVGGVRMFVGGALVIALGRWAVPVFLMVSGALLLDPAKDVGWDRLRRYVLRMVFVLCTFGLLFCLIESVVTHGGLSVTVVGEALLNLVTARSWGHLWSVYALLGLYLLTPALRTLTVRENRLMLERVLAVLYVGVLGTLTVLHLIKRTVFLPVGLAPATFYYLLGWYAWRYLRLDARTIALGVGSLLFLLVCQVFSHGELALPEYCFVAPYGVLVFLLFVRYAVVPTERYPLVTALADRSFGIYVVHPLFLHVIVRVVDPLAFPAGVYELLAFAVTLLGSMALVDLVRRIPGVAGRI